jgi:hypothetical protein
VLHALGKITTNSLLVLAVLWAAAKDYCLAANVPFVLERAVEVAVLGLMLQIFGAVAVYSLLNGRNSYFRNVLDRVSSRSLKATLLLLPFVFFLMSHQIIAFGLFGTESGGRLATAEDVQSALRTCSTERLLWKLLGD